MLTLIPVDEQARYRALSHEILQLDPKAHIPMPSRGVVLNMEETVSLLRKRAALDAKNAQYFEPWKEFYGLIGQYNEASKRLRDLRRLMAPHRRWLDLLDIESAAYLDARLKTFDRGKQTPDQAAAVVKAEIETVRATYDELSARVSGVVFAQDDDARVFAVLQFLASKVNVKA